MLLVSLFQWWYGDGLRQRVRIISGQLEGTLDYFSIELLLKTLFMPFRQISAESVSGALDAKLRAFADKMISRIVGAMVRIVIMIAGIIAITLQVILGIVILIGWALVPIFPVVGIVLMIMGWTF